MVGISVLLSALGKLQRSETILTGIHADVCKLCLASKCFPPAYNFLQTDFTDISKDAANGDPKYILLYFYYGGMILAAVKVTFHFLLLIIFLFKS